MIVRFRCAGRDCDCGDEASAIAALGVIAALAAIAALGVIAALAAIAAGATHQRRRARYAHHYLR